MPINYQKLEASVKVKILSIIAEECQPYGGAINPTVKMEITEDFIFAVSHAGLPTSETMHRYGLYVYSALGFSLLYHSSNVIGKDHFQTLQTCKQTAKNFFAYHANLMDQYL
jgi:hypothetical protein